jgi:hypothetical protein
MLRIRLLVEVAEELASPADAVAKCRRVLESPVANRPRTPGKEVANRPRTPGNRLHHTLVNEVASRPRAPAEFPGEVPIKLPGEVAKPRADVDIRLRKIFRGRP